MMSESDYSTSVERRKLMVVSQKGKITYYSGAGAGWTVPEHSPLVPYAAQYDLNTITSVFDGTPENPLGKSIDFAGPNTRPPPYTFTIDMQKPMEFTHWRVAGNPHYRFGKVHLECLDMSTGEMVPIEGSECDYDQAREEDGFAYATFNNPVIAQIWQIRITSHANADFQARFQCYLTEAQFGSVEAWERRQPWMMAIAPYLRGEVTEAPIQMIFDIEGLIKFITSFL